jgi:hypothetical protein
MDGPDDSGANGRSELFVVEWSYLQQAYHVTPLECVIRANFRAWLDQCAGDYRMIALLRSHEAAHALIAELDKLRPPERTKTSCDDAA